MSTRSGDQLLPRDHLPTPPPRLDYIIRCERRRVRFWAGATALLWLLAAAYLLALLGYYLVFLHPAIDHFFTTESVSPTFMQPHMAALLKLLRIAVYWPVLLLLAAACTLVFTLSSRRASLRQIQASLADISAQLRELGDRRAPAEDQGANQP